MTKAILSLLLVGLLAQSALCGSRSKHRSSYSGFRNDQQSDFELDQTPTAFRRGNEYVFEYNGQISSGIIEPEQQQNGQAQSAPSNSDSGEYFSGNTYGNEGSNTEKQQKAVLRVKSEAKITFTTEDRATLRLEKTAMGKLNQPIVDPKRVQPMPIFSRQQLDQQSERELELPCEFNYVDGVVRSIQFHPDDKPWSKNVKRAVLNLIQVNLKAQNEYSSSEQNMNIGFSIPETTIEGECLTTYVVNKNMAKFNNYKEDKKSSERNGGDGQEFNVTKSINFKQCKKIADVAFGFQGQDDQTNKCKRINAQQVQHRGSRQIPYADEESCDPKEVNEEKLDRSAVQRFELVGNPYSPSDVAIKRSEALSHFVLKNINAETQSETSSAMHTITIAELNFLGWKSASKHKNSRSSTPSQLKSSDGELDQGESLLFDNDWNVQVKRFYMYGDVEISRESSPFRQITDKIEQATNIYQRLIETVSDKTNGMEAETVSQVQRLAEILRMCSGTDLEQIYKNVHESQKKHQSRLEIERVEQLLADTLAIAGTRNSVHMLVQKILNKQLKENHAIQALKNLQSIPAPSDSIVELVKGLCQNEVTHRHAYLKQSCWLTYGAMVGDLCRNKLSAQMQQQELYQPQQYQQNSGDSETPYGTNKNNNQQWLSFGVQSAFDKVDVCSPKKKESYKQALVQQYEQAETTYEKVLALKAIGNSGLDIMVNQLERIISGEQEKNIIARVVAIDSLRRLRTQMPRKIQRILLPVYQNTNEKPQLRMAAFSLLMSTEPEQHIVDQVAYTLSKERSVEVQSFCQSVMSALAQSKISREQQIATHLETALKLANIDEEQLNRARYSRKLEIPIYSAQQQEGVSLKYMSIFTKNQMLPGHIAAGIDAIYNGKWQRDMLKVSLSQAGTDRWLENCIQAFTGTSNSFGKTQKGIRSQRSEATSSKRADQELRDIFSNLGVKSRSRSEQSTRFGQDPTEGDAFAMFTVRLGDVDTNVLPISSKTLPETFKRVLESGEQPSLASFIADFANSVEKRHIRSLSTLNFNEKQASIATPVGFPLNIFQSTPILANVEAVTKVQTSGGAKVQLEAHLAVTAVHIQKMEIWTPSFSTGVESYRGIELNAPLHLDIEAINRNDRNNGESEEGNGLRVAWKVPQPQKTRLFGLHTLCSTFTSSGKRGVKEIRAVQSPALERTLPQVTEIDRIVGEHSLGMPVRVRGHFRMPRELSNYAQIAQILMATENHLHVVIEPSPGSPKEIAVLVQGNMFQKVGSPHNAYQLNKFYDDADKQFLPVYPEDFQEMELDDTAQRRQKLGKALGRFEDPNQGQQMYKHWLKATIEAKGQKKSKAEIKLSAVCDSKMLYCKMENEIKRSPIYAQETSQWTLNQQVQILAPESVSSLREYLQLGAQKHQKFVGQMETEWGTENKQFVNIRVQGENAQTSQQRKWLSSFNQENEPRHQQQQRSSSVFLNKFDITADYKLSAQMQNAFQRLFEVAKSYYFWNTKSRMEQSGRDSRLFATMVIDPLTQCQANISVRTASQSVRFTDVSLPIQFRPMPLIRPAQRPTHSIRHAVSRYTTEMRSAKCQVDNRRVQTFDGVFYKAPITQCYSVLAKDCSNSEQPQFAVLMKSLNQNGQQKKLKVITPEQVIRCEPKNYESGSWKSQKITCYVNDEEVQHRQSTPSRSSEYENWQTVEYNNDEQTSASIRVNGVTVRFACQCGECSCQRATIKLSDSHKNTQCGLCGHYDDSSDNELRMNNGDLTNDLAQFHRSYSLKDEGECTEAKQASFYNDNKHKYRVVESNENDEYSNENGQNTQQNNESNDNEFDGGYAHDDDSDEDWMEKINMQNKKSIRKSNGKAQEPIMKTMVLEHGQRICFSTEEVKQCPEGTSVDYLTGAGNAEEANKKKQNFACLSRSSSDARQLERKVRFGKKIDVSAFEPNFSQSIEQPKKCVSVY